MIFLKRFISAFLVISIVLLNAAVFASSFGKGDLNNDGVCDVLDCVLSERHNNGHALLQDEDKAKADFNGDGNLSLLDVRLIIQKALGLELSFNVNKENIISVSNLPADRYSLMYENENGLLNEYSVICNFEVTEEGSLIYDKLIVENCAPVEATSIGVYNSENECVGNVPLNKLDVTSAIGEKQYSFAALSDTHIGAKTAADDLKNAFEYFKTDSDIVFTTICGDLTLGGTKSNFELYKSIVDDYATIPVYAISGNHDANASFAPLSMESLKPYTGQNLYYSFEKGNDVYIMLGMYDVHAGCEFAEGELQWLYETLEVNRNKRCFLFTHLFPRDGSGDAVDLDLEGDMLDNVQGEVFYSLLSHYSNVIYFHGHSHERFEIQEHNAMNNYDNIFGCHSVHIPSLAYPKSLTNGQLVADYSGSQGYIIDVYENSILLKGRDFVTGKFLPIATYSLDTKVKNVVADTYYDSTGTIINSNSNIMSEGASWFKGSVDKSTITEISFEDKYLLGDFDESWDASISCNNQVVVYRNGDKLTVVGNANGIAANKNSSEMFSGFKNLTTINNFEKLNVKNISNMSGMFKYCAKLQSVNLNGFVDVKPIDMMNVFNGCSSLKEINLSKFDLSDVNKYTNGFYNCSSLERVVFPEKLVVKPTSIYCYNMFGNCSSLTSCDMSIFDGKNLNLGSTFSGCSSLNDVKFGKHKLLAFNTTFNDCSSLKKIDISGFDTTGIENMNKVFAGCKSLEELVLPDVMNTSKVKTMRSMFEKCEKLFFDCSNWDTTNLTDITSFNSGAPNVKPPILVN